MEENAKEKKSKKKFIIIIIILLLIAISSTGFAIYTYAKYISAASADAKSNVSKWSIKVSGNDITAAGVTSLGEVNLVEIPNDNVVDGTIAPSSSAYATYDIDPTGTQVSFNYKFSLGTITANSGTVPTGLTVTGVKFCKGSTCDASDETKAGTTWTNVTPTGSDYIGSVDLSSQTAAMTSADKITIKVLVSWTDDEDAGATVQDDVDDVNHTAAGVSAPTLTMPIQVTVYQKVS